MFVLLCFFLGHIHPLWPSPFHSHLNLSEPPAGLGGSLFPVTSSLG